MSLRPSKTTESKSKTARHVIIKMRGGRVSVTMVTGIQRMSEQEEDVDPSPVCVTKANTLCQMKTSVNTC